MDGSLGELERIDICVLKRETKTHGPFGERSDIGTVLPRHRPF
jgi:hypothetical protein